MSAYPNCLCSDSADTYIHGNSNAPTCTCCTGRRRLCRRQSSEADPSPRQCLIGLCKVTLPTKPLSSSNAWGVAAKMAGMPGSSSKCPFCKCHPFKALQSAAMHRYGHHSLQADNPLYPATGRPALTMTQYMYILCAGSSKTSSLIRPSSSLATQRFIKCTCAHDSRRVTDRCPAYRCCMLLLRLSGEALNV